MTDVDSCEIGDEGCEYLSRGQWPIVNIHRKVRQRAE